MIKIRNNPIYTIEVYEGSITIDNEIFEFTIDSGDSYAEIKWNNLMHSPHYSGHLVLENQIFEEFEKMMWKNE